MSTPKLGPRTNTPANMKWAWRHPLGLGQA